MTSRLLTWLNKEKGKIDKIVETTFFRLLDPLGPLDPYMPVVNYTDLWLAVAKFNRTRLVANIIDTDGDIPTRKPKSDMTRMQVPTVRLAASYTYGNADFMMFKQLEQSLAAGGQNQQAFIDYFYQTVDDLVPQVLDLHTYLSLKVASTGQVNYTDPVTGANFTLDYPGKEATLFPAALAGGDEWDQAATATGVQDIQDLMKAYYDINGFYPAQVGMTTATFEQLVAQDSTKEVVLNQRNLRVTSDTELGEVFVEKQEVERAISLRARYANQNVSILLVDAQFDAETYAAGEVTTTRMNFWPNGYIILLAEAQMERAIVPIAENDFAGGIHTSMRTLSEEPRRERSLAMAGGTPFVPDIRMLSARKVTSTGF